MTEQQDCCLSQVSVTTGEIVLVKAFDIVSAATIVSLLLVAGIITTPSPSLVFYMSSHSFLNKETLLGLLSIAIAVKLAYSGQHVQKIHCPH